MDIIRTIAEMQATSRNWLREGQTIALVPTMGFLHEGHLSLVDHARRNGTRVVTSIFVNPMQFGPTEDLERYPRDEQGDLKRLEERGNHAVFLPGPTEMYPNGFETYVETEHLPQHLCGLRRKGHFRGVTTIVSKLFNAVLPDVAVFGEKDYQQLLVIRRMTVDMNFPVRILSAPTLREPDGLAMSSRNTFLSPEERIAGSSVYKALQLAREAVAKGENDAIRIRELMMQTIEQTGGRVDYVAVVHPDSLDELELVQNRAHAAVAAFFGNTRLIDNLRLLG